MLEDIIISSMCVNAHIKCYGSMTDVQSPTGLPKFREGSNLHVIQESGLSCYAVGGLAVAEAFESRSEEYDRWYLEHSEIVESEARAIASLHPTGFGIEIGVGSGIFASRLGVRIGIDPTLGMLRKAASRGIACVRAVGELLPFHDHCFDFALIIATLCFLQDADIALEEAYRVLTSDGVLIVCIIPRDSKWGLHYLKKSREGHPFYSHARFYTVAELETLLSRHDFSAAGWASTLSFGPDECPKLEEPSSTSDRRGFTCVKARKTS